MRILILANKMPYPPKDGGAIATLSMARGFAQQGNKITLLAMNTHKHNFDIDKLPEEIKSEIEFHTEYVDIAIKPTKMLANLIFSRLPYNAKRFISRSYKEKIINLLSNNSYDIIQLEGLYLYPYISILRKHFFGLISFRAHNIEHEIWKRATSNQKIGFKKLYMKILSRRLAKFEVQSLNKFDLLIPITKRDGHIFEFLGNNAPKYVAPVGVNLEKYQFSLPNNISPEIAFIGSLDWNPNLEGIDWFLDNTWPLIIEKNPNIRFHIAGRNAPPQYKQRILRKNIIYHGEVDDAFEYISNYTYMIVPLLSGSGMRVKIIEGMATGKVIFTTSIGAEGLNAINKENIFIDDTPTKMADTIVKIIANKDKTIKIAEASRKFIENNFNNLKIAKEVTDFYASHLSQ